jgi:hypothetical protein
VIQRGLEVIGQSLKVTRRILQVMPQFLRVIQWNLEAI